MITPILMLGAGRMGGAMIEGWLAAGAFAGGDLIVRDPQPGPAALAAQAAGAALNPPEAELARARTVVLAVKPQIWREAAAEAAPWLHADAVIVSIAAGVRSRDIAREFGGRCVARVMPTTAAAIGKGTATRTNITFKPVSAKFVKITQTDTFENPGNLAIGNLRVYSAGK